MSWIATSRTAAVTRMVLGAVIGALVLVGSVVVWALWQDRAPVSTADLHSGSVVLLADGSTAASLGTLDVVPELDGPVTTHVPVTITNAGSLPIEYRLDDVTAASGSDPELFSVGLSLRMSSVTDTSACTGASPGTGIALTTGAALPGAAFVDRRPLAPGASEVLCASFTAPSALAANFRRGSAGIIVHFQAQNT